MTTVVVYTMKGCPFCTEFKDMLKENKIRFIDRDIDKYSDEYNLFVEATENDYIPALMIIKDGGEKRKSFLYAPERNYNELSEAVDIIQGHRQKLGLI